MRKELSTSIIMTAMICAMRSLILIAHNLRSAHNVGSLLRTADGLGVETVILSGYTPYPAQQDDARLPHEAAKVTRLIHKTALGAEDYVHWRQAPDIELIIKELEAGGYQIVGLEQTDNAIPLPEFRPPPKLALILGREVEGMEQAVLDRCDRVVEIPMHGKKESFNVVQAAAIASYHIQNYP
jgi:tRNA G18 (ribose-2'-O)-methylase SpoU